MSFVGPLGWTLRPVAPYHVRRVAVGVSGTSECYCKFKFALRS